ncbi:ABC transporter substrate-binding protein [Cohnella abietis]|uniref:ABC transporter substrate-binding protein n=1 Tax=Cohnella abietis TaxID=2507935 RepID=A0A3T1DEE4_9BACL|nr:extracellular solute-binding protein [Cohnella abietis]BBI36348.1 ABC transporter substrate-binding protein [Cohnella abietis]
MKKSLILIMAMVLTLMTACSSNNSEKASPSTGSSEATASNSSPSKEETEKPITLTMMTWQGSGANQKAWDAMNEKFHKEFPNITVINEPMDSNQYSQIYKARLASGEGPDIFSVYTNDLESFVKAGYVAPLNDLEITKKLDNISFDQMKYDGNVYGIPASIDGSGIIYNKDIFAKLKLEIPKTWSELLAVSEALKNAGYTPFGISVKEAWLTQFFFFQLTKASIQDKDPTAYKKIAAGEIKFADTKLNEAFEKFLLFKDKGYFSKDALGLNYDQSKAEFAQGKAAMYPGAIFFANEIREINPQFEIGFMEFPTSDNPEDMKIGWGGVDMGLYATGGKNREAAKKYIDWLFKQENYSEFVNEIKWLPVYEGIDVSNIDPIANDILGSLLNRKLYGADADSWNAGVQDTMFKSMQEAYAKNLPASYIVEAMDKANKRAIELK